MARRQSRAAAIILNLMGLAVVVPYSAAGAATITVNTTADTTTPGDGYCTLREALANVNAAGDTTSGDCIAGSGAGDSIDFNLTLPATIMLSLGQLMIGRDVTIAGPTNEFLRLDGQHVSRIFEISAGAAGISDLSIANGSEGAADGGGILVDAGASLALTRCALTGNKAAGIGGGISNRGSASLTDCTLTANAAAAIAVGNFGGGIFNSGTATLTDCMLTSNKGGGIDNFGGTVTLTRCTVSGNTEGGVDNCGGTASLTDCTLSNNEAFAGGGFKNLGGTATLTNCTLGGNRASRLGGGVFNSGNLTLTDCTLNDNTVPKSFGGANLYDVGTTVMTNTIVTGRAASVNCAGVPLAASTHNVISDATCVSR